MAHHTSPYGHTPVGAGHLQAVQVQTTTTVTPHAQMATTTTTATVYQNAAVVTQVTQLAGRAQPAAPASIPMHSAVPQGATSKFAPSLAGRTQVGSGHHPTRSPGERTRLGGGHMG